MKLSTADRKNLTRFEDLISKGIDRAKAGLLDVGTALARIREGRLYRETHETFEDYCRLKWKIGKSRAYQLISFANGDASTIVDNEGQARELLGLSTEDAEAAVAIARADGEPLTAAKIQTGRELLEQATAGLQGKEKRQAIARTLNEAAAAHRPRMPSKFEIAEKYKAKADQFIAEYKKRGQYAQDVIDAFEAEIELAVKHLDRSLEKLADSQEDLAAAA